MSCETPRRAKKEIKRPRFAAAVIEWESRVEKVLLPAIEPLAAMLKGAGWTCDIERTPQGFKVAAFRGDMVVYGSRERPSLSFELQKGKDLVTLHEATPSGVRLDAKLLGVSVEPDVVKNRIVEFVSKLALK